MMPTRNIITRPNLMKIIGKHGVTWLSLRLLSTTVEVVGVPNTIYGNYI